jgi:hypothetical protein
VCGFVGVARVEGCLCHVRARCWDRVGRR